MKCKRNSNWDLEMFYPSHMSCVRRPVPTSCRSNKKRTLTHAWLAMDAFVSRIMSGLKSEAATRFTTIVCSSVRLAEAWERVCFGKSLHFSIACHALSLRSELHLKFHVRCQRHQRHVRRSLAYSWKSALQYESFCAAPSMATVSRMKINKETLLSTR